MGHAGFCPSTVVHGRDRLKHVHSYSLMGLSTHKNVKCYPTMTKIRQLSGDSMNEGSTRSSVRVPGTTGSFKGYYGGCYYKGYYRAPLIELEAIGLASAYYEALKSTKAQQALEP